LSQAVDSGSFATREYDFKKPRADLSEHRARPRSHGNADYEVYDFPGGYTENADGEHYARLRMEALQSGHESVTGAGAVRGAAPGYLLSLENHRRGDQNRQYLVTGIELSLQDNPYESDGAGAYRFDCVMRAMPVSETWRPKRVTPKPRTTGPETALVVGPPGEEIHTDPYGRVKVQFPWDRIGTQDQNSSCWVRVSHPWA
ncbi:type VI secretion system Vgr family protein, partial [Sphingomonas sp. NCPPB 2930]